MPVVITGLVDAWPAQRRWTLDRLRKDFGNHKFKVWDEVADGSVPALLRIPCYTAVVIHGTAVRERERRDGWMPARHAALRAHPLK